MVSILSSYSLRQVEMEESQTPRSGDERLAGRDEIIKQQQTHPNLTFSPCPMSCFTYQ